MTVVGLKTLAKELGLTGYPKLRKAEFISFVQNNPPPTPAPRTTRSTPAPRPTPVQRTTSPTPAPRPRGRVEPPVEVPSPSNDNAKKIRRMKKQLRKLNKKIKHSKKKHNGLISKRNSIRKKIEELKV